MIHPQTGTPRPPKRPKRVQTGVGEEAQRRRKHGLPSTLQKTNEHNAGSTEQPHCIRTFHDNEKLQTSQINVQLDEQEQRAMTSDGTSAIQLQPAINQDQAMERVKVLANIVRSLRDEMFKDGLDYGTIPGTNDKQVLLLPGMEKLMRALQLRPEYELVSSVEDFDKPLFHYRYECRLYEIDTGRHVSTAIGSCNSRESKYAWRWVERHEIPGNLRGQEDELETQARSVTEFKFAIEKAETEGQYGKPAEYWQSFQEAIESGKAKTAKRTTRSGKELDAYEWVTTKYRIPNPDIFDQINTIDKIAQKRALGSAIKGAANVSEFFTVDLEDLVIHDTSNVVDGDYSEETTDRKVDKETGEVIDALATFRATIHKDTGEQLSDEKIATLAGIAYFDDRDAWREMYGDLGKAREAVLEAFKAEQASATPKNSRGAKKAQDAPESDDLEGVEEHGIPF